MNINTIYLKNYIKKSLSSLAISFQSWSRVGRFGEIPHDMSCSTRQRFKQIDFILRCGLIQFSHDSNRTFFQGESNQVSWIVQGTWPVSVAINAIARSSKEWYHIMWLSNLNQISISVVMEGLIMIISWWCQTKTV